MAKLLFFNGKIASLDASNTLYEVMGINGHQIDFLGDMSQVDAITEHYDEMIDLKGQFVMPGFNDSHLHLLNYGYSQRKMDLTHYDSIEAMILASQLRISESHPRKDQWFLGRGWNQDRLEEKRVVTRADLDRISMEIPIVFTRVCGHMSACNTAALNQIAHLQENQHDPNIDIEQGLFYEEALNVLFSAIPSPDSESVKEMILSTIDEMLQYGITSVQSDDLRALPDQDEQKVLNAYMELAESDQLKIKVYEQCLFFDGKSFEQLIKKDVKGCKNFRMGPLKLLLDGSLGARTALLSQPYSDAPETHGVLSFSQAEIADIFEFAMANNVQVAAHAIGDGAMDVFLTEVEKSQYPDKVKNLRNGIVHAQITNPSLIQRMKNLHMMAYVQPIFLDYDIHIVHKRTGARADVAYAFKSMLNESISVTMGTDAPVVHFNPFENIYCAVERKDLNGYPKEGYLPHESLSRYEVLRAYTYTGAYASFEEMEKGTLEIGKCADFIILDQDLLEVDSKTLLKTKVLSTYVDGKCVYSLT